MGAGYLAASVLDKLWTDLGRFDVCLSFLVESHRRGVVMMPVEGCKICAQ